ncbi:unnamed protein product, partial [marine sediment metagenome]
MKTKIIFYFLIIFLCPGVSADTTYTLDENYGRVPVTFVPNVGQFPSHIKFGVEGNNLDVHNDKEITGLLFHLVAPEYRQSTKKVTQIEQTRDLKIYLQFEVVNSNPILSNEIPAPWNTNYFIGNDPDGWHTDVPNYKMVKLHNIYDDIDLVCESNGRRIDFNLVVHPDANLSDIVLTFPRTVPYYSISGFGGIKMEFLDPLIGYTSVTEPAPYCYQVIDGQEIPVESRFVWLNREEYILTI